MKTQHKLFWLLTVVLLNGALALLSLNTMMAQDTETPPPYYRISA